MAEKVEVKILGKEYTLETNLDPLQVNALAKDIEERLQKASQNTAVQTPSIIALLVALNVADDFYTLQTEYENLKSLVNKKTEELISVIDSGLK